MVTTGVFQGRKKKKKTGGRRIKKNKELQKEKKNVSALVSMMTIGITPETGFP